MNNSLTKNDISVPAPVSRNITLTDNAKYFEKVDNLSYTKKTTFITTIINGQVITSNLKPNNTYYNLFILDGELFDKGYFIIKKENALTKYMGELKFDLHNNEILINVRSYPCLFANINNDYKVATDNQNALFGYIAGIEVLETAYKIYFSATSAIQQNVFNHNESLFGIKSVDAENEFDKIHWSIKKINIKKALNSLNISVAAY